MPSVGATAVGVHAPTAAALAEAALASVAVGLLAAAGNIAAGLPVAGSVLFGASWTGIGLVGAAIALVAAQVSSSARTVGFLASAVIGTLYLLRAVGDTSASWLSWLTPFGWGTQLSAWSEPRVWLLAGYPLLAVVLTGAGPRPASPARPRSRRPAGPPRSRRRVAAVARRRGAGVARAVHRPGGWTIGIAVDRCPDGLDHPEHRLDAGER